jgi:LPXTG-motif cell wall-anchored protein
MMPMKGARALASGMLVLAAVCVVPAISAAQDAGTTTTDSTTTTTPAEPLPGPATTPADAPTTDSPAEADASGRESSEPAESDASPAAGAPAATPAAAPPASSPKARKAASASVTMGDFFFSPASVSVAVGDTVTWRNNGDAPHNAVADDGSFSTPNLNNGQSASETFSQAGTFSYICTIHPQMKGTVRVLSSSGGGSGGGGGGGAGTGATGESEAAAVASPDAAGDANTLPATGMAAGALALVGLLLLAAGALVRRTEAPSLRRWLSPF